MKKQSDNKPAQEKPGWILAATNLYRNRASNVYFANVRIKSKLFRQSLKTKVLSVAKLRLTDFIKEKQETFVGDSGVIAAGSGKMTVGQCISIFQERLDDRQNIKPGAKLYRRNTITILNNSWPELEGMQAAKVSKDDCAKWAAKFAGKYSASLYNNTVGTLRMIFKIAVELHARSNNPANDLTKRKITLDPLHLPSSDQFSQFVTLIDKAGGWCSHECADLVRFLAYGGFRKFEAANILWSDIDLIKGQIIVRKEITKNGEARTVPIISDMKALLDKLKAAKPNLENSNKVMTVQECQKAMNKAAQKVGMARITHHDLRHLFATRCIESGVDIPTVSRWLGHKDGGALAMKTYGHLRNEHSQAMAQKVKF